MPYDIIIIGGGPAGLTAAIYATRYEMKTLVIAKEMGGQLANAPHVDNYPGVPDISGFELMKKMEDHAKKLGVEIADGEVAEIKNGFKVITREGKAYKAKSVIVAAGTERRHLNVPGEKEFLGKGVSYCATCDGPLFRDAVVGVVGGSDSAAKEALLLAEYAKKVYIIYRRGKLRAEPATAKEVADNPKIEVVYNTNVTKIIGEMMMTGVELDTGGKMDMEGLFIEIGGVPVSHLAEKLGCELNEKGEIKIDMECKTACSGIFAAGDVTTAWKQAVVAAGYGAVAAYSAYLYVKSLEAK